MNCKNCNAVMRPDHERKVFVCPYCESTEPFAGVSKDEIQGMLHDAIHDVKMESLKEAKQTLQMEAERGGDTRSTGQKVKDAILMTFQIGACLFLALLALGIFVGDRYYTAGIITLAQLLLVIIGIILKIKSWNGGEKKEKYRKHSKRCHAAAAILVVAWLVALSFSESSPIDIGVGGRHYSWPNQGLGSDLPAPEGQLSYTFSSATSFQADVEGVSAEAFLAYVQECKDCGFDIDVTADDKSYQAYNEQDDHIKISFRDYSKKTSMSVQVDKGIVMETFYWPNGFAEGYPVPEAEKCYVKTLRTDSSSSSLEIYVGDVTRQQFMDYVSKCMDAGYEGSYYEGTDSFYGRKSENSNIKVEFLRGRIMYIDIWDKK